MSKKDVQDYLEKGMYGTPEIKPAEKKLYLGTFRERIYLTMTFEEMKKKTNLQHFLTEQKKNPQQQLLLHGALSSELQHTYLAAAQKYNCPFKIVESDSPSQPETIGLVYTSNTAVNIDVVAVTAKYAETSKPITSVETTTNQAQNTVKKNWFRRLFT